MTPRPSKGEYPDNWAEIAYKTKCAAKWRCVRCNEHHNPKRGYMLTVHHLDLNKSNCRWWNLAALCQRCHLHIQHKVVMQRPWLYEHSKWFTPYVAGFYAHRNGLDDSQAYVAANLDALLSLRT